MKTNRPIIPVAKFTRGAQLYMLNAEFTTTSPSHTLERKLGSMQLPVGEFMKIELRRTLRSGIPLGHCVWSPVRRHDPTNATPAAAMEQVPAGAASVSFIWEPPRCLSASRPTEGESPAPPPPLPSAVLLIAVYHYRRSPN